MRRAYCSASSLRERRLKGRMACVRDIDSTSGCHSARRIYLQVSQASPPRCRREVDGNSGSVALYRHVPTSLGQAACGSGPPVAAMIEAAR